MINEWGTDHGKVRRIYSITARKLNVRFVKLNLLKH